MTTQEEKLYQLLWGLNAPITEFRNVSLDDYISKLIREKKRNNSVIGYQVPYFFGDRTYWSDFSINIPNELSVRIECKSLNVKGSLSRSVIGEMIMLSNNIPENELIILVEGDGFNTNEFTKLSRMIKTPNTKLIYSIENLIKYLENKLKVTFSYNVRLI